MLKKIFILFLGGIFCMSLFSSNDVLAKKKAIADVKKIRIVWDIVPDAAGYDLIITKGKNNKASQAVLKKEWISTPGYEIDASLLNFGKNDLYWSVRGIDINNKPLNKFSQPQKLSEAQLNPVSPLPTTKFDEVAYAKMYPVYSWIPVLKASGYDLQVYYDEDHNLTTPDKLIVAKEVQGQSAFDYYDEHAYRQAGRYWWRVRAKSNPDVPLGKWSEPVIFNVESGGKIASLGDSITHGGGAVSVPPSEPLYDWQHYSGLKIRNLGYSGNTVSDMLARFNDDVLAFKPEILVIMGGINDLRAGTKGVEVIQGLNRIKYKCSFYNITPVFVTVPPINPYEMKAVSNNIAASGWLREERIVNEWITRQTHYVDITDDLSDFNGWLRPELSSDGLHPDVEGKRIIGEKVGAYLKENFIGIES